MERVVMRLVLKEAWRSPGPRGMLWPVATPRNRPQDIGQSRGAGERRSVCLEPGVPEKVSFSREEEQWPKEESEHAQGSGCEGGR